MPVATVAQCEWRFGNSIQLEGTMKHYFFRALLALSSVTALGAAAQAQDRGVVVHIQKDFVAGGKTLPAGKYRIAQELDGGGQVLTLRGEKPNTSVYLVPLTQDGPDRNRQQITMTRVGDAYYLTEVATELGVFTLATPRVLVAKKKPAGGDAAVTLIGAH
jgi:hypothetical protein